MEHESHAETRSTRRKDSAAPCDIRDARGVTHMKDNRDMDEITGEIVDAAYKLHTRKEGGTVS